MPWPGSPRTVSGWWSRARFCWTAAASPWHHSPSGSASPGGTSPPGRSGAVPITSKLSGRALDDQARSRLGFPVEGVAWSLPIVGPSPTGTGPDRLQGRTALEAAGSHSLDLGTPTTLAQDHDPDRDSVPHAVAGRDRGASPDRHRDRRAPRSVVARRAESGLGGRRGHVRGRSRCPCVLLHRSGGKSEPDHRGTGPGSRDGPHSRCLPDQSAPPEGPVAEPLAPAPPRREDRRIAIQPARECFADPGPARWRGYLTRAEEGRFVVTLPAGSPGQRFKTVNIDLRGERDRAQDRRPAPAGAPGAGSPLLLVLLGADHASPLAGPGARARPSPNRPAARPGLAVQRAGRASVALVRSAGRGTAANRGGAAPARRDPHRPARGGTDVRRVLHPVGFRDIPPDHRSSRAERSGVRPQIPVRSGRRGSQGTGPLSANAPAVRTRACPHRFRAADHVAGRGSPVRSGRAVVAGPERGHALGLGSLRSIPVGGQVARRAHSRRRPRRAGSRTRSEHLPDGRSPGSPAHPGPARQHRSRSATSARDSCPAGPLRSCCWRP